MDAALCPGLVCAGRYELLGPLGEGGVGLVWSARHLITGKSVALKFLRAGSTDRDARQRFLREARAVCAIRHVNVIEVHDLIELDDGTPMMVMDLLEGETLGQRLRREGNLALAELVPIMLPVLSALEAAHALGIVHRDLKPENIFLCAGREPRDGVKVLDFGLAKMTALEGCAARSGALTGSGAMVGTPYYMSPEQVFGEGDIDARADIWSLGIILHESLAGRRPTEGSNVGQILKRITTDDLVSLREIAPATPAAVADLVSAMLSKGRESRPAKVEDVRAVLARHATGPLLRRETTRSYLVPFVALALVATAAAVFSLRWIRTPTREIAASAPAPSAAPVPRPMRIDGSPQASALATIAPIAPPPSPPTTVRPPRSSARRAPPAPAAVSAARPALAPSVGRGDLFSDPN